MTEQQIQEAYELLDAALVPPPDSHQRVATRVRSRRRRRRASVIGLATVAVLAVGGTAVVMSGGDGPSRDVIATDPPPGSTLTLMRPDGSTYDFPEVTVSCKPPLGEPMGSERAGRIWLYSPIRISADDRLQQPFVLVQGVVDELQDDATFELPIDGPSGSDSQPLILFVADTEGSPQGNEVVSNAGDAAGTVRVTEAACDPVPVLRLEIDATLGSEEGRQPLDVAGSVR